MDLQLTPEQVQLRDATRRVLGVRLESLVALLPEPPAHDAAQVLKDALDLGWLGLALPTAAEGLGDFTDLVVVHEELGRGLAPSLVTSLNVAGRLLLHAGASTSLLAQVARGELLVGSVLDAGGSLAGSRLTASLRYVVDATCVTHLLVPVDGQLVLVALDAAGVTVVAAPSSSDVAHCRVELVDVTVEPVGTADAAVVDRVRLETSVLAAARAVGGGRAVLDRTVDHVRTRHQFDRPIGTFQAVQHQLADVATALDAAGLAVARAAWGVASEHADMAVATAVAGLAAMDAFASATLTAHQLHGGMGFVLDSPLHLWSARAVADPTVPFSRRELVDLLATASGLPRDGRVVAVPHHREAVH